MTFNVNDFTWDPFEKEFKERITEFQDDPLVLATTLYRILNISPDNTYLSLDSEFVKESITAEDRVNAEAIRKYYSKKFFWSNLSKASISSYRSRLCVLLETKERKCKDQDCGIYYKLPWFYHEDMIYEDFKKQYVTTDIPQIIYGGTVPQKSKLKLTYLKSSICRQHKRKIERFWFTDGTYLYNIELEQENPLLDMFKSYLLDKDVTIEAFYREDRIDQLYFYKLFKFNFVKG